MKGIRPKINKDRIQGLVDAVSDAEDFDEVKKLLNEAVVNFTMSVVDDAIKENAEFQFMSGLAPKSKRTSNGKCCKWCDRLVGTYNYEDVRDTGNDVFRRHRHCRCTVEFITNGKRQNVHTKKWEKDKLDVEEVQSSGYNKNKHTKEQLKREHDLKNHYNKVYKSGHISRMVDFKTYREIDKEISATLHGIKTVDGIIIKSHSLHFIDRIIGHIFELPTDKARNGVAIEDVKDALLNYSSSKVKEKSIKLIGRNCVVTVNPITNQLIQTNPYRKGQ